ncbi:hypothetical protein Tco_1553316, partial [Tanacetum coccineum]
MLDASALIARQPPSIISLISIATEAVPRKVTYPPTPGALSAITTIVEVANGTLRVWSRIWSSLWRRHFEVMGHVMPLIMLSTTFFLLPVILYLLSDITFLNYLTIPDNSRGQA